MYLISSCLHPSKPRSQDFSKHPEPLRCFLKSGTLEVHRLIWTLLSFNNMDLDKKSKNVFLMFLFKSVKCALVSDETDHKNEKKNKTTHPAVFKKLCTVTILHYANFSIVNCADVKQSRVRIRQSEENLQKSRRLKFKSDL